MATSKPVRYDTMRIINTPLNAFPFQRISFSAHIPFGAYPFRSISISLSAHRYRISLSTHLDERFS